MGAKYLFVINSFLAGGAERSLLEMLPRLVDHGVTPIIACLHYRDVGFEEEVRAAGFDVRLLEGETRLGKIRSLRRLIRQEKPALVYTSLFDADLAGRVAALGCGVPVMSNLANTAYDPVRLADPNVNPGKLRLVRMVDGFTARRMTDHFHAVSEAVKDSTVANLGVAPHRITVVKRGRDLERLGVRSDQRRRSVRNALGLGHGDEVIVTVGRQEYQKGQRYLIEAMVAVVAERPDARLLIVGREGHSTAELAGRVADLGLGDHVTFLGHRADVADVMAASDVFAFPSLYEGLGGALIEAMALGLPIVASDIPALREVVVPGVNADLAPATNTVAWSRLLIDLLADPERLRRYGSASRDRFDEEFRAEVAVERMIDLFAAVAAGDRPATEPDDRAVATVVNAMEDRRGPLRERRSWTVVRRWRSFKAEFVELAATGSDSIAVKFGENWNGDDPRFVASEIGRVRQLFEDLPGGGVHMPRALGWSSSPPAVALELVPGTNLFEVLADERHSMWAPGPAGLETLVVQCGAAIGAYHSAEPADPEVTASGSERNELFGAARRVGIGRSTIQAVALQVAHARGFRFSPNDFIIDADGGLVMLDPPHVRKFEPVHRDLSAFTFELHRFLVGERPSTGHPRAARLASLREAFLSGYATTGPIAVEAGIDAWMLRFFEVSRVTGHAYGKVRKRRLSGLAGTMRWAWDARRRLGAPPADPRPSDP